MNYFRDFTLTLGIGEVQAITAPGNAIQCTAGDAAFTVQPEGEGAHAIQNGLGFRYKQNISTWWITNGGTAQTVTVYIGTGDIIDNRLAGIGSVAVSSVSGTVTTNEAAETTISRLTPRTVGLTNIDIRTTETDRKWIMMRSLPTNTAVIWLGMDTEAILDTGWPIYPGESVTLPATVAVYAISTTAGQVLARMTGE